MKAVLAVGAIVVSFAFAVASAQATLYQSCGELIQGVECVLFKADSGGKFLLGNLDGFRVGDRVCVVGQLDPFCATICMEGNGCIRDNTISRETGPPTPTLDHYKCYSAATTTGTPKFVPKDNVMLVDPRFESKVTKVLEPVIVCNPVDKNGEGINDPDDILVCYSIKDEPHQTKFPKTEVQIHNQFGQLDLTASKSTLLCVPSKVVP